MFYINTVNVSFLKEFYIKSLIYLCRFIHWVTSNVLLLEGFRFTFQINSLTKCHFLKLKKKMCRIPLEHVSAELLSLFIEFISQEISFSVKHRAVAHWNSNQIMAPPGKRHRVQSSKIQVIKKSFSKFQTKYLTIDFAKRLFFDPSLLWISAIFLLFAELFVNVLVIHRVPCTWT